MFCLKVCVCFRVKLRFVLISVGIGSVGFLESMLERPYILDLVSRQGPAAC